MFVFFQFAELAVFNAAQLLFFQGPWPFAVGILLWFERSVRSVWRGKWRWWAEHLWNDSCMLSTVRIIKNMKNP